MKGKRTILTDSQEKWLVRHYRHTKNDEICERLGVSGSTMHRIARALGLKKSHQFMRKCQMETAAAAKASHLRNGTYPPKGYRVPRAAEGGFKKGVTPLQRLGPKREAERVAKAAEGLRRTRREERARAVFGVPRKTKLKVVRQPRKKTYQRWYLKKHGYIVDDAAHVAYWTEGTSRRETLEKRGSVYYRFAPMHEGQETG